VGYYEMAARMMTQLRSVIISANGVIVPVVAEFQEKSPDRVKPLYLTSYQILVYLSLPSYSLAIVCLPFISRFWIGHYEPTFMIFGTLLACGWLLNILNGPAYFTYLGTGELRWNVIAHTVIAVFNPFLGIILGMWYGGVGVVTGWVCALALGSSVIYISFHLQNGIPLGDLLPKSSRLLAVVCALGVLSSLVVRSQLNLAVEVKLLILMLIGFALLVAVSMWFHPVRQRLFAHLGDVLKKNSGFRDGCNHEGAEEGQDNIPAGKEIL
jgi:O-antigen/teichoic acid export membrane protein